MYSIGILFFCIEIVFKCSRNKFMHDLKTPFRQPLTLFVCKEVTELRGMLAYLSIYCWYNESRDFEKWFPTVYPFYITANLLLKQKQQKHIFPPVSYLIKFASNFQCTALHVRVPDLHWLLCFHKHHHCSTDPLFSTRPMLPVKGPDPAPPCPHDNGKTNTRRQK